MARRAESPVERAKQAVRANERSEWTLIVTLTKSASLLYEIRTSLPHAAGGLDLEGVEGLGPRVAGPGGGQGGGASLLRYHR